MRRVLRINGMSSSTRRARDVCPRLETRLDALKEIIIQRSMDVLTPSLTVEAD